jgi:MFS family permease
MEAADPLTAAPDAVPSRRAGAPSLGECWRSFIARPSPPLLLASILIAAVLRGLLGSFSWRDLVVVAALIALTPIVEWAIHVFLLHCKPFQLRGRRIELVAAREHRAHHEAPALLEGVLLPRYAVLVFVAQIALTVWVLSFPLHLVLGGHRLAYAAAGLLVSLSVLGAYEWCHFLIHTPYRPRGRYFRSIWCGHRLHHYKNEHYWFGVTSTVGDLVLRTAPAQSSVAKSGTARTLGVDVDVP